MIISRTPFRISFFGGGTDYPVWIQEHGGAVIGTTINHFCYTSCRYLPPFFDYNYRICYSKIEDVKFIEQIQHPAVNGVLSYLKFQDQGLEIHHAADLPARAGLGSSSAFVVGLCNALLTLREQPISKGELSQLAIHIEQKILNETVGCQDQTLTAHGGLNCVYFSPNGNISVHPVNAPENRIQALQSHLLLFFTGFSRYANEIAKSKVANFQMRKNELHRMHKMVKRALDILQDEKEDLLSFGELLHESWQLKKSLSDKISSPQLNEIYEKAMQAGAIGGKLLGAGGGGFMLFFVPPFQQEAVKQTLSHLLHVPFQFENSGSSIIVNQPTGFIPQEVANDGFGLGQIPAILGPTACV
jgi:D-glycero-alpha-D-manno-heptose-7-phosphate kinase